MATCMAQEMLFLGNKSFEQRGSQRQDKADNVVLSCREEAQLVLRNFLFDYTIM
jgi:hypothetical protein